MEGEPSAQTTDRSSGELERDLHVVNRMGIHARPATKIVELTGCHEAAITFTKDGETVDGKSIFGVMTLAAVQGASLTARADGEDAEALLDALEALFQSGFDELDADGGKKGAEENAG